MGIAILGTGSYLPRQILTSAELGRRLGVGDTWIEQKTRIRERRVAADDEATSDLATHAARRALAAAAVAPHELDLVVVATATPDQPIPSTACHVQAALGASRAAAFDVAAACTGFLYALAIAHDMLLADDSRRTAMVIGADIYSRALDYTDRGTAAVLGDGAGAVVLGKTPGQRGVIASVLRSDGNFADLVHIPAGGTRQPTTHDTVDARSHYLTMQGGAVRRLVMSLLPELVDQLLDASDCKLDDVDLFLAHQANGAMLADWADRLHLPLDKVPMTVDRFGNTGAASIPITLDEAVHAGLLHNEDVVLLIAFGAGVTWGGMSLCWTNGPDRTAS